MFVRTKFVTNSSSTSFIGWGLSLQPGELEKNLFKHFENEEVANHEYDRLLEEEDIVKVKHCSESGYTYVLVSASAEYEDQWYVRLRNTYTVEGEWEDILKEWCNQYGIAYDDPHWMFATVY